MQTNQSEIIDQEVQVKILNMLEHRDLGDMKAATSTA